jgi:capsular polysaccharide biosynthesis protein
VRHSELFVAEVPNGRIYTGDGYVITPDDLVLADLSPDYVAQRYIKRKHSALASIRLPKLHRLPGATACLATPFAGEFFGHWIMDLVPRIGLLTSAGYKLADIDWFYLPGKLHSYQAEILARLDIGREKIIESDVYPHVKVDRLLAPSAVFGTFAASRFVCDYLVDAFGGMNAPAGAASKKIYVSRRNTSHRRVVNEPEVMAFLSARGYVSVEPQGMSMQEQQDLFRSADVVVMPLGSALVHTVFCRPGTKVIELLNPRCVQICTLSICTQQRLEYYYLLCNGVDPLQHVIQEDIVVDMARLADVMAMAGA